MSWPSVIVTIRCSNLRDFSVYQDIQLRCLALEPHRLPENLDTTPDISGYEGNQIVHRYEHDADVAEFSVAEGEWDHAEYEIIMQYLAARFLRIQSVYEPNTRAKRSMRKLTGDKYWYWTTDEALTRLPINVRLKAADPPEGDRDGGGFRLRLTFRETMPIIGVTI